MGDRFALDVQTSQLPNDDTARRFIAALTQATTLDARMVFLQPNVPTGALFGNTVVDGSGQGGTQLVIRGGTPARPIAVGRFVSVVHEERRYVHMITSDTGIDGNGRAALKLWPMLRFYSVDGEAVEMDTPSIEGQLIGFDARGVTFERNRANPVSFTIQERA